MCTYVCVCVCIYIYTHVHIYKYIYIYVNWDFLTVPCMIWMLLGFSNATMMVHSDMASAVSSRGHSAVVLSLEPMGHRMYMLVDPLDRDGLYIMYK